MPTPNNTWYAINKKAETPDEAEVLIYDEIGAWGIDAKSFVTDLSGITARRINVRLNTPGGSVFDGTAIHNALKAHPAQVVMHVEGVAASAGSFVMLAGDEVRMADNAYVMIHNSAGGVMGGADDMRGYADLLEKIDNNIALMYAGKTGKPPEHYRALMDAETWFTADEAKAEGLVDAVYAAAPADRAAAPAKAAHFGAVYNKIPDPVRRMWGLTPPAAAPSQPTQPPEGSTRVEPPPAQPQEAPRMETTTTQAAPAQAPAPATNGIPQGETTQQQVARLNDEAIQNFVERGKTLGRAEGRQALMDEFRAIVAVCPGRAQTAVNAFLAGQNASTVKLIVDAELAAEAAANRRAQEQEVEIARLRAEQARLMELGNVGGHPGGVNVSVFAPAANQPAAASTPTGLEPEAQAELEWDSNPLVRAQNGGDAGKKRWMLYRVNQLKGAVRVLKTA